MNTKKISKYRGVILFYIVIAILSFLFSMRVEYLDQMQSQSDNNITIIAK